MDDGDQQVSRYKWLEQVQVDWLGSRVGGHIALSQSAFITITE